MARYYIVVTRLPVKIDEPKRAETDWPISVRTSFLPQQLDAHVADRALEAVWLLGRDDLWGLRIALQPGPAVGFLRSDLLDLLVLLPGEFALKPHFELHQQVIAGISPCLAPYAKSVLKTALDMEPTP